jgi:pyruvate,water dikinase
MPGSVGHRRDVRKDSNMTHRSNNILWLGEPASHNPALVGGKAATLSALAADQRIPPGFCVTTRAYAQAWRSGATGATGGPSLGELAPAIYQEIAEAYRHLGEGIGVAAPAVAVRSSAVDEDGRLASYAGQHATYLHVVGTEAIADAIERCWMSASAPPAQAYRRARGRAATDARVAVLVQQFIVADCSAVLFTAHPLTGSRDEIVITASWGLGESIVGGTVTPDTYVVRKADLAVTARRIADKRRMTVVVQGGTREVAIPRFLQAQPTLREDQVVEMARLGLSLETALGWPVDVECAYQAERLYLLQCRPVTTLAESLASSG